MRILINYTVSVALIFIFSIKGFTQEISLSKNLDIIIFPANDQDLEKQEFDEFKCYKWSVGNTGYDPMNSVKEEVPTDKLGPDGSAVKGAVGGAVFGALIGAVAGDTKKGVKIGAVAGGLSGAASKASRDAEIRESIRQQQEQNKAALEKFKKAFCTCMDAKGYKATY